MSVRNHGSLTDVHYKISTVIYFWFFQLQFYRIYGICGMLFSVNLFFKIELLILSVTQRFLYQYQEILTE